MTIKNALKTSGLATLASVLALAAIPAQSFAKPYDGESYRGGGRSSSSSSSSSNSSSSRSTYRAPQQASAPAPRAPRAAPQGSYTPPQRTNVPPPSPQASAPVRTTQRYTPPSRPVESSQRNDNWRGNRERNSDFAQPNSARNTASTNGDTWRNRSNETFRDQQRNQDRSGRDVSRTVNVQSGNDRNVSQRDSWRNNDRRDAARNADNRDWRNNDRNRDTSVGRTTNNVPSTPDIANGNRNWRDNDRNRDNNWRGNERNRDNNWRDNDRNRNNDRNWRDSDRNRDNNWRDNDRNRDRNWSNGGGNRNWQDRSYAERRFGTYDRKARDGRRDWNRNDHRYGNRRESYRGSYRHWDNRWRDNRRYDWYDYRRSNRSLFSIGFYYSPYRNYSYSRLFIGYYLDSLFYDRYYWIEDPWYYRLPPAYGPYRWVRYYDDVLLVDVYSGEVVDVIYDFFW